MERKRMFKLELILAHLLLSILSLTQALPRLSTSDLFNLNHQASSVSIRSANEPTCGYASCPQTDSTRLNVHIIAHTHDDVGWLKTVDQYYYGTNTYNAPVGVQHILDSILPQLVMDPEKRFIYVEMSFFTKWWEEQDERVRSIVHRLVNEGRLEFINGGWCMNDEANVNYMSTIEQMTLGLKFLNETFGQCAHPKVGWQIDPFGHTNEQASLFAQFGFDGMFFTRISFDDKLQRAQNKSLDLVWHGDRVLGGQSGSIFTNIFKDNYDPPSGYCFDVLCREDNLVDNKKSYEYNIDYKAQKFVAYLREYANVKAHNHILVPMGGDFHFSAAGQNFKNIDRLMRYIRRIAPDLNIFYSTPSCYQYAVHQATKVKSIKLAEKYDDFMPYASTKSVWWSGYFTSRPSVKLIERETANLLQISRFISLANLIRPQNISHWVKEVKQHEAACLSPLWQILGDLQHHDAVTGTQKQHVADDYVRRASDATLLCAKFIGNLRRLRINDYLRKSVNYDALRDSGKKFKLDAVYLEETMLCPALNISQCDPLQTNVDSRRYLTGLNSSSGSKNSSFDWVDMHKLRFTSKSSRASEVPKELQTRAVLVNVYNPLARHISQHDIRLPCNGGCNLEKVKVIHLSTNETMRLIRLPVPAGILQIPHRDATTTYEILFYANIPALGYTSFVVEDLNTDEIIYEENDSPAAVDAIPVVRRHERSIISQENDQPFEEINLSKKCIQDPAGSTICDLAEIKLMDSITRTRQPRDSSLSQQSAADRVIVKFDPISGMIVGLKRVSDGSLLNITQKFGYYWPAASMAQPGAYIFRPNSSEPILFDRPMEYKMYKRKNGSFIEIHQKWADWLWQTVRVDAKKNYIEFDYVVGPIPIAGRWDPKGREVVSRYITSMTNNGVFLTDSNNRQLLPRHKYRSSEPEELGGSFYPVVSTIMLRNTNKCNKCSVEAVAILVDRAQGGTSLNEGELELLIHRRHMRDDNFGVGEPLDEPGEDGRGLVTRGKHRMYVKFQEHNENIPGKAKTKPKMFMLPENPLANIEYEKNSYENKMNRKVLVASTDTYIVNDAIYNDLNLESKKDALKPILSFDRLRVSANEFVEMIASDSSAKIRTDLSLLNTTLPNNVHLLTLQPWGNSPNQILIRLENLDNPLTIHPFPDIETYQHLVRSYETTSQVYQIEQDDVCHEELRQRVEVDIEYLIKRIRIVALDELNLGANVRLVDDKRLDWTEETYDRSACDSSGKATSVKLSPRQIRTFLARFEFI